MQSMRRGRLPSLLHAGVLGDSGQHARMGGVQMKPVPTPDQRTRVKKRGPLAMVTDARIHASQYGLHPRHSYELAPKPPGARCVARPTTRVIRKLCFMGGQAIPPALCCHGEPA
ncbi:hypothetical protein NSERUTF1_0063 [Nocardia seriolae]|nr:hypothetical protein NSERUTF1_0063 [Nocardia seriolae]